MKVRLQSKREARNLDGPTLPGSGTTQRQSVSKNARALHSPDQLPGRSSAEPVKQTGQSLDNLRTRPGIADILRTHLHGSRARHHHLHPITGMRHACATCQTILSAIGKTALPEKPPIPAAITGRRR